MVFIKHDILVAGRYKSCRVGDRIYTDVGVDLANQPRYSR